MGLESAQRLAEAMGTNFEGEGKAAQTAPQGMPESEKPAKNLDDPLTQEQIMNPFPRSFVCKDGYEMKLYEPSLKARRRLFGFATRVLTDAGSLPGVRQGLLALRVVSLLNSREDLEAELFSHAAALFASPNRLTPEDVKKFAAEIDSHASEKDVGPLFNALCDIVGAQAEEQTAKN